MDNSIIKKDVEGVINVCQLEPLCGKSLLLTGASGLIGTYILYSLDALYNKGKGSSEVYAVIHRSIPEHLQELEGKEWLHFIRGNLADYDFCRSLPQTDYIIHAAGYGQPGKFLKEPVDSMLQNTMATYALLEKLKAEGKFLFVSSCAVYAGNPKPSYSEADISYETLSSPRLCYIEGKRCGEAICELFRRNGTDVKIVRPSFTYGPGVRKDDIRVMYEFIRKAMQGRIEMRDSGKAIHIYEYVTDAIEEIWNILLYGKQVVYNLAGYSETTIYDMAEKIAGYFNASVIIPEEDNTVPGAIMKQHIDTERVETEFNKHAFVEFDEGLRRTVEWYTQA